jgi:tRNA-dihydrouridine synthase
MAFPHEELYLAPMAGLSHGPMRRLIAGFGGCDLYWTEMIWANALLARGRFERSYLDPSPRRDMLVYQLVGCDSGKLADAAMLLNAEGCHGIDINMGCSAPEIVKAGAGAAWLSDEAGALRMLEQVRKAVRNARLCCKIRVVDPERPERLIAFARAMEAVGVEALTVHPRSPREKLKRHARWGLMRALSGETRMELILNGDVRDRESLDRARLEAGSMIPVMLGREAARRPWVFAELKGALSAAPNLLDVGIEALRGIEEGLPPEFHKSRARRFLFYFCDNLRFGNRLKMAAQGMGTIQEMRDAFRAYFEESPEEARSESG